MANFLSQYTGAEVEKAIGIALNIENIGTIYCETLSYWQEHSSFIGKKGDIIIVSDYKKKDNKNIAGIKVADGLAYAIDLPYVNDILGTELTSHINDTVIHVSQDDRDRWDNKVSARMGDNDTLILY